MLLGVKRDVTKIVWTESIFFEFIFQSLYVFIYLFLSKTVELCGRRSALDFKTYYIAFFHAYKKTSVESVSSWN